MRCKILATGEVYDGQIVMDSRKNELEFVYFDGEHWRSIALESMDYMNNVTIRLVVPAGKGE